MKKQLLTICLLIASTMLTMAQKSSNSFSSSDNLLNVGFGVGSPFFGAGYSSSLPINPTISYEHGVTDEISVGAQLSYASSKYSYNYGVFGGAGTIKYNATYFGARGSYHLNDIIDLDSKFDLYGGASLGYVVVSVSDSQSASGAAVSGAGYGLFGGGKYFFSPSAGVYAELGYQSLSFLNVGVTLKF